MIDTVASSQARREANGQYTLSRGSRVALRMWRDEQPGDAKPETVRDYEVAGFVIAGRAELLIEGHAVILSAGDSWIVPAGASHAYRIVETFTAVEATAPPH